MVADPFFFSIKQFRNLLALCNSTFSTGQYNGLGLRVTFSKVSTEMDQNDNVLVRELGSFLKDYHGFKVPQTEFVYFLPRNRQCLEFSNQEYKMEVTINLKTMRSFSTKWSITLNFRV